MRTYYVRKYIFGEKKKMKNHGGQVLGLTCKTCVQKVSVYLSITAWTFGI